MSMKLNEYETRGKQKVWWNVWEELKSNLTDLIHSVICKEWEHHPVTEHNKSNDSRLLRLFQGISHLEANIDPWNGKQGIHGMYQVVHTFPNFFETSSFWENQSKPRHQNFHHNDPHDEPIRGMFQIERVLGMWKESSLVLLFNETKVLGLTLKNNTSIGTKDSMNSLNGKDHS